MIEWLVSYALRKRLVVSMICIFVGIYGYYSWTQLAVEAYPDIADITVQVVTQAPGLAAEEIEQKITIPLERELNGTPGLLVMRSKSTFGLSLITLIFRDGIENYWARQRVLERIQNVTLPGGVTPGLDPISSPAGQIYYYVLQSDTKGLRELSELQRWVVGPALKQVPGVADITTWGGITTQFQLELEPEQLMRFNLSLKNVTDAVNANSANSGGSIVTRGDLGYVVRGIGAVENLEDFGNIVVTQRNDMPIFVRDLGKLRYSQLERHGILGQDGKNDVIEGIVLLLRGENPSRVMAGVHAQVAELNERLKLDDVAIVPYLDRSDLTDGTIEKVSHTIFQGVGLVLIILIMFLGSPRSALIVGVTIPFAMMVAFTLMYFLKIPANIMSIGAIDFGIIVDGAIVMTEAILRRREAKPDAPLTEADVRETASQVARPIFFATLIIIAAYLPLFALQRVEAKLFYPMAYAVSFAQFGALAFTLLMIPGIAYLAYRRPQRVFHNPVLAWLERAYRWTLRGSLERPRIAYALVICAAAGVVWLSVSIWREFLPDIDEGSIWLHGEMPAGLSLEKASEMTAELRRALLEFPEVSSVVTHTGRNDDGTDPWPPSHTEAAITLKPYASWPNGGNKKDLIRRIDERLHQMPGYDLTFSQPIIDSVADKMFDPHSQIGLKVFGNNFDELRRIGREIVGAIENLRGVSDVAIEQQPPLPQIVIKIDREAIGRYGINISDVADLIQTGIGGGAVSQVFVGDRRYDTTVRFPESTRNSPEAIGNLLLTSSKGALIPLSQVARIQLQEGESTITRETNRRHVTVKLNFRDRELPGLVAEANKIIAEKVAPDPRLFRLEWGGQFEKQQRAEARFQLIATMIVALMLVLLFAGFGTLRHAFLILGVVPLATLGGLLALHLTDTTLNVASGVGFVALFGVAVLNGVIMVANLNRLRDLGLSLNDATSIDAALMDAILSGACERLRPVLMTASVATVGMLPAAMATGVGSDVQRSVATVVAGGLVPATLLTLFILPTFYFVIERWFARRAAANPVPAAVIQEPR
jgi:heavy metal efflux system protein